MNNFEAVGVAEGTIPAESEAHHIAAWQQLIDNGMVWVLASWFGREARRLIEKGFCHKTEYDTTDMDCPF